MHEPSGFHPASLLLAGIAVMFIGRSKAGFGGGLGMLTTPLCVLSFGAKDVIGILLPLLCAGDAFSFYHDWGKWERKNLQYLLPGVVAGVIIGVQWVGRFSARELNIAIGLLAVSFALFQTVQEKRFRVEGVFAPNHAIGIPCGIRRRDYFDVRPRRRTGGQPLPHLAKNAEGNLCRHHGTGVHVDPPPPHLTRK